MTSTNDTGSGPDRDTRPMGELPVKQGMTFSYDYDKPYCGAYTSAQVLELIDSGYASQIKGIIEHYGEKAGAKEQASYAEFRTVYQHELKVREAGFIPWKYSAHIPIIMSNLWGRS